MADVDRVPTVDDLRVKLCYICREEERYDDPADPPRAWTHPCSCTLVAHESCLLQWIKSAQQDRARALNALKCPQCGATYELQSDNPRTLRMLNAFNSALSSLGKTVTVLGVGGLAMSFGFTFYLVSTSYGAFAVKEFLGQDMYNILLTDNVAKWPWHAFIQLPMIPLSLILSRTRLSDAFPLVPLFLTWASSPPVGSSPWSAGQNIRLSPAVNWPPTPLMVTVLLPVVRIFYRRFFQQLTKHVMGTAVDSINGDRIRRVVWELNENGLAPLRVRIGANIDGGAPAAGARNAPPPRPEAPRADADANGGVPAAAPNEAEEDAPDDPAAVAERTLHVTTSSIGRFIGGALLIPTISSRMGTLLLQLSRHSSLLRKFLAIRHRPLGAMASLPISSIRLFGTPPVSDAGLLRQLGSGLVAGLRVLTGGTPTWNTQDPVWWRNTVGLGLFIFAKDCVELLHLWLTARELESRRVKNRSFAGVDIRELDLISHPREEGASSDATRTQEPSGSAVDVEPQAVP